MKFVSRAGEIESILELDWSEWYQLTMRPARTIYGKGVQKFLQKFLEISQKDLEDANKESNAKMFPLISMFDPHTQFGKVFIQDPETNLPKETPYHFEPTLQKHKDGTIELLAISIVHDTARKESKKK